MAAKSKNKGKPVANKPVTKKKAKATPTAPAPASAASLARSFQLEIQSVPPPPPNSVVTLDPDVAPHFPNSRAVNEALRALVRIVKQVKTPG